MKRIITTLVLALLVLSIVGLAIADSPEPIHIRGPWDSTVALEATYPPTFRPVTRQVFPEGCVGCGFTTWLVIFNSTNTDKQVVINTCGDGFFSTSSPFTLRAHQRRTLNANEYYRWERPDISFQVLSDGAGVYGQVSMYWPGGGHTSTGFMVE